MQPHTLFEDNSILVIEKPSGVVVNRAESVKEPTVQDWVDKYLKIRSTKSEALNKTENDNSDKKESFEFRNSNFEFYNRSGIAHRIDKETSGILLIAKNPEVLSELLRQFKEREIQKTYIALCHGLFEPKSGMVKIPVGRLPWNRERFGLLAGGRDSESYYKVIEEFEKEGNKYSLVEWYPKTGRTHQIRIHAKHLGHALVADNFYAGRKTSRNDRKWCPRLFLHAAAITFTHPVTKEKITVTSPLAEDLKEVIREISIA